jgi:transposase
MIDCPDKAGGIDVHSRTLVATIVNDREEYVTQNFLATSSGHEALLKWFLDNGCSRVLFEATGVYWYPLYLAVFQSLKVVVANPWHVKCHYKVKTDKRDSRWLARLCLKEAVNPSRVFVGDRHEFRELSRHRETLVKMRTALKNRVHRQLVLCNVKLGSVFTDCFGKKGRHILEALLGGTPLESILEDKKLRLGEDRKRKLREAVKNELDPLSVEAIRRNLEMIDFLDGQIRIVEARLGEQGSRWKKQLRLIASIPGVGVLSAHLVLSEIGDIEDFETGEQLASYFGIVPFVSESGGKPFTGHITKHGSPHMRRVLIQIAHVIGRMKCKMGRYYNRLKERKGAGVAAVATARKLLCLIHHLLKNDEEYEEEGHKKKPVRKMPMVQTETSLEHAIEIVQKAGFSLRRDKRRRTTT